MADVEKGLAKSSVQHTVYKLVDGTRVPSVTTILGIIAKPSLLKWANDIGLQGYVMDDYRKETAKAGTLAHEMIQEILGGPMYGPDMSQYTGEQLEAAKNSVRNFEMWLAKNPIKTQQIELPLVSEKMKYGGKIDVLGLLNDELWLMDFKTSKGIFPEHEVQLSAYWNLLLENGYPMKGARILQVGRVEDGFTDLVLTEERLKLSFDVFATAQLLYIAKQKHEKKVR